MRRPFDNPWFAGTFIVLACCFGGTARDYPASAELTAARIQAAREAMEACQDVDAASDTRKQAPPLVPDPAWHGRAINPKQRT